MNTRQGLCAGVLAALLAKGVEYSGDGLAGAMLICCLLLLGMMLGLVGRR